MDKYKSELIKLYLERFSLDIDTKSNIIVPYKDASVALKEALNTSLPDPIIVEIGSYLGSQIPLNAVDAYGYTPLDYLPEERYSLTCKTLKEYGSKKNHNPVTIQTRDYWTLSTSWIGPFSISLIAEFFF